MYAFLDNSKHKCDRDFASKRILSARFLHQPLSDEESAAGGTLPFCAELLQPGEPRPPAGGWFSPFSRATNNAVYQFQDADDFYQHMCSHGYAVKELWNQFDPETSVVMELEYPDNFNPLFIDINDFQLLMPPMMVLPPYTEDSF